MCFSATASFVAGSALLAAGAVYLKKQSVGETGFSRQHYLALIPCLFGLQQLLEGIVWLGVQEQVPASFMMFAAYGFSFLLPVCGRPICPLPCICLKKEDGVFCH